ncbi:MAG: hypothetical protein K2M75_02145, partial [Clostridia bacterium]|nr:hypothetical protein [Clostridia bacterium]
MISIPTADASADTTESSNTIDLMLDGYEDRSDDLVFDGMELISLYKKLTGNSNATFDDIKAAVANDKRLTSENIRTNNGSSDIIVKIGGYLWNVMYLSSIDVDGVRQPILTLWLTDSDQLPAGYNSAPISENYTSDSNKNYPMNLYGVSKMRAVTLNNGGYYATSSISLCSTEVTKDTSHPLAKFTVDETGVDGSLTKFVVKPQKVSWQETLATSSACPSYSINLNNEAYGKIGCGYEDKPRYNTWANDTLWLPAMGEVGWQQSTGYNGLWKTSVAQRRNGSGDSTKKDTWLRSVPGSATGVVSSATNVCSLVPDGTKSTGGTLSASSSYAVRPAFHLNLALADECSAHILKEPNSIEVTYKGNAYDINDKSWHTDKEKAWYSDYFNDSTNLEIKYLNEAGTGSATLLTADNYKVKITIKNSEKLFWANDNGENYRIIDFVIKPKKLSVNFSVDKTKVPPVVTATPTDLCDNDSSLAGTILRTHFTGTTGKQPYDSYVAPTQVGNYKATVEIDPNVDVNGNYVLAKSYYDDTIKIDPQVVAMPTIKAEEGQTLPYTYNGQEQCYIIGGYSSALMEISIADEYADKDIDIDGDTITFKNAGNYENAILVTLKNAYDSDTGAGLNVWNATSKDSNPKYLSFEVKKAEIKVDVYVAGDKNNSVINGIVGNESLDVIVELKTSPSESLNITITAKATGSDTAPVSISNFDISTLTKTVALDISSFKSARTYNIDVEADLTNYEVKMYRNISLSMKKVDNPNLVWLIWDTDGTPHEVEVDPSNKDVVYNETSFVYNGKVYSIEVSEPSGYKIKQGTFVTKLEDTTTALSEIKNAGAYVSTVTIAKDDDSAEHTYTIKWTIDKATFNMSDVKWKDKGKSEYTGSDIDMVLDNLPEGLEVENYGGNKTGNSVGSQGEIRVDSFKLVGDAVGNYEIPDASEWKINWEIVPATISVGKSNDWKIATYEGDGYSYDYYKLVDEKSNGVVKYEYYETDNTGKILEGAEAIESLDDIEFSATLRKYYKALPILIDKENYCFTDGVTGDDLYSPFFTVGGGANQVGVSIASNKIEYNGKPRNVKLVISGSGATLNDFDLTYYAGDVIDEANRLNGAPTDKGNYLVVITSNKSSVVVDGKNQYTFEIIAATIKKDWNKDAKPYVLKLKYGQIDGIEYEMQDADGNSVAYGDLKAGNKYQIKAKIKDDMRGNYSFTDGTYETGWEEFELRAEDMANLQDPNDPSNTHYPQGEDNDPENPNDPPSGEDPSGNAPSGDGGIGSGTLDELLAKLKEIPLWQLIASVISIILIIIFTSKGAGYLSKAKQNKTMAERRYKTYYAGAFLGLAVSAWTAIACVLMGLAVVSLVFMILAKGKYNKSLIYAEELRDDYERNKAEAEERKRDEHMQMMFMSMMGGNAGGNGNMGQGGYAGGYGIGAEEMRLMINDAVAGLLPGMQQALPQQASSNDEAIQQIIKTQEELAHNQELIMDKLSGLDDDKVVERVVEREVASASVNDETIKQMMKNQEMLMEKILELSANQKGETQVVEKIVEVPVEVENMVDIEVVKEVPVEKVVEKI